jgi:glycogen debranching enzyme
MIRNCYEKAKIVLKENSTKLGVIAGREYYNDVWGRDGLVSCLGMSCSEDEELIKLSEKTITSIAKFQKPNGQLPNKFSPDGKNLCFGEGGCVDTSLWFPIVVLNHYRNTRNNSFLSKQTAKVEKAVEWAGCLDLNNDFLLETHEGSDWMDLLVRSGRVLYDQVLYYKALLAADEILGISGKERKYTALAKNVKKSINLFFWPRKENLETVRKMHGYSGVDKDFEAVLDCGEKEYYYADVGFRKYDPRCDIYANLLAIVFDVTDAQKAASILDYIQKENAASPYPVKVLHPPIDQDFFRPFYFRYTNLPHLQEPGNYHNGGIWPMAGGFYVMALKKLGRNWSPVLEKLAEANKAGKNGDWEFNEWLNPEGIPMGSSYQSWSAAMYVLAHQYVKGKAQLWWLSPSS